MNFEKIIKRKSKLLLPFSWLYRAGVVLHNKMYDWGWKRVTESQLPVICVGNLSVGGTGKTPMVEYLLQLLSPGYTVATISRGYKRISVGVHIAGSHTLAKDIGDEPMQLHSKFPDVKVVVGEKRVDAMTQLLQQYPQTEVVVLDDAFQHRAIAAGFNLLLTDYNNLFTDDYYLPAGQLRDLKKNYKKADVIIVTKSPAKLSSAERDGIIGKIKPLPHQSVYFTTLQYGKPYHIFAGLRKSFEAGDGLVLVSGIANPQPLISHIKRHDISLDVVSFPDHHRFTPKDIEHVKKRLAACHQKNKYIITTEKDAMRLKAFEEELSEVPVYAIPIQHQFLYNEDEAFNSILYQFVENKKNQYEQKK